MEKKVIIPEMEKAMEKAVKDGYSPHGIYMLMVDMILQLGEKAEEEKNIDLANKLKVTTYIMMDFAEYIEFSQDKLMHQVNSILNEAMSKMSKTELPKNVKKNNYKN